MVRKVSKQEISSVNVNESINPSDVVTPDKSNLNEAKQEVSTDIAKTNYSRCGGALKAEREKQQIGIHEICTKLRLSSNQIEAIEADQFSKLPQPTIVRGFIRNYAKLLKIDPTPIIEAYNQTVPKSEPQSFTVKPSADSSVIGESDKRISLKTLLTSVVLLSLVGLLYFYYSKNVKPNEGSSVANLETEPEVIKTEPINTTPPVEFALPAAERAPQENPTVQENSIVSTEASAEVSSPETSTSTQTMTEIPLVNPVENNTNRSETVMPQAADPTDANIPEPINNQAPAKEVGIAKPKLLPDSSMSKPGLINQQAIDTNPTNTHSGQLLVNANEETWVNVIDARGKEVYSKVLTSGSSELIQARPPLRVTIGNAKGASLTFNGDSVDLTAHTRNKVARLKLE